MRRTLLLFALLGSFLTSFARPVDIETAITVASKFMGSHDLQLSATYTTDKDAIAFYIFNTQDGFVIVSADDCETPIIGYSHEGRFDPTDVPVQMEDYLQEFVERIQYGIENHIEADESIARQWEWVKATGQLNDHRSAKFVEPLLTEKWHQGCLYNSLCPEMIGPCDHAEVGCVAVAMGQIMHYWGYPSTGWGSNTYSSYGTELTADFGNTLYDWEHMPDSLTGESADNEIEAIATLLFHCGVAVNMSYSTEGSNANSRVVPDAMKRYFNYSRHIKGKSKGNDNDQWISLLKSNLDLRRPIYYSGSGSDGGHAFVCDGYDANDLLHFNWGWGGNGDGYFALGSMNPNGHPLNGNNYAILDIIPQYDPCLVSGRVYPPDAGSIEGLGEYHIGEQCTLVATPVENSRFSYWKKGEDILSYDTSVSMNVENDIDIEAFFSYQPVKEIMAFHAPDTNDLISPYVSMSWDYATNQEWNLLKQFEIDEEKHIATDGKHIYTAYASYSEHTGTFGKYTMDGELVEFFTIDGARPDGLTCDGDYFYCSKNHSSYDICRLYRYDFENKTLLDSTYMNTQFGCCAYDDNYDSFWLLHYYPNNTLSLVNREGQILYGKMTPSSTDGFGPITAPDGNRHLLVFDNHSIFDYDIIDNSFSDHPVAYMDYVGYAEGGCIGKYDGKDAAFVIVKTYYSYEVSIYSICIYEINCHLAPIQHYRIYRADSEGHIVMLADEVTETSYIDSTWNSANAGLYRFGISEVYYNGSESEIIWSNTLEKTDFGIEENEEEELKDEPVIKVFENGHIVIIKDGKRYTMTGQQLN